MVRQHGAPGATVFRLRPWPDGPRRLGQAPLEVHPSAGLGFICGFLDALGLERAFLVGNSLSSLLALATALDLPQRMQRVVLEDAAGLGREVAWLLM